MNHLWSVLNQGWFGSALGIIGLILAVIFYRKSKIAVKPLYQTVSTRLLGFEEAALPDDVQVSYRDHRVQRLTKTHVVFWNAGSATLRRSEVIEDDRIRFELSTDERILEASILKQSRSANKFALIHDPAASNRLFFEFDYLDACDGAAIEILHTARSAASAIKGTIRGVPDGLIDGGRIITTRREIPVKINKVRKVMPWAMIILGFLMASTALVFPAATPKSDPLAEVLEGASWVFTAFGVLYTLPGFVMLWMMRRKYPAVLETPELR